MSKYILFDFLCPQCGVFEDFVKPHVKTAPCPKCQLPATRQISPGHVDLSSMAMADSASPEAISHFERVHRERRAIEERRLREHGDYGVQAGADGGSPMTPERAGHLA